MSAGRGPVVLRDPGVTEVSDDALARLAAAAEADTTIATVSALRAPAGTAPPAQPLHPVIAAPVPGLVHVTRAALDLVGDTEDLEEIGRRTSALGLLHVLADDVVAAPAGPEPDVEAPRHALQRAVRAVAAEDRDLTVTVDARALGPYRAGTQVVTLEVIAALARTDAVDLRVLVAHDLPEDARAFFAEHPHITTATYEEAAAGGLEPTDVVHRPSQVFDGPDLLLLRPLGHRLVITHQDLIAYRSPAFAEHAETWRALRIATRAALGGVDHVVFLTEAGRRDALRDELVVPERTSVIPNGVDHHLARAPAPAAPAGFDPAEPYLLALGAPLPHKNLPFAERLAAALGVRLVGAGPGTALGQVTEAEKAFLLAHAAAVAYPTLYEGFGLIPFEAGAAGVPCLFAPVSALAETLPRELATLVPWDVEASAAAVRPLLTPGPERTAHVEGLRRAAAGFTWDAVGEALLDVYRRAVEEPLAAGHASQADLLEAAVELNRLGHRYGLLEAKFHRFLEETGRDAWALVGEDGLLTPEDRRALLAILARPSLRGPFQRLLRLGYRAGHRGG